MEIYLVTTQQAEILANVAQVLLSLASVVVAAVLAYVTYQYYIEIKRQTSEMQRDRQARFMPVLKATLVYQPANYYHFAIVNTGKGAAHDVNAEWRVDEHPHTSTWSIPHFAPGDQYRFAVQLTSDDGERGTGKLLRSVSEFQQNLAEEDGTLHYKATCEDALGETHPFKEDLPLLEIINGRISDVVEWQDKDELREIRKNIEGVEKEVKKVRKSIELGGNESLIRGQVNETVRSIVNSREKVTFSELKNLTGFKSADLYHAIYRLENAGEIESEGQQDQLFSGKDVTIRSANT